MNRLPSFDLFTILIAALGLALAGCAVGPDYQPPETTVPPEWASNEAHAPLQAADQQWWKNFNDPVLTNLIDKASADNLDLKIAEARILQARANVSTARADLLPSGDIKGTATREANQMAMPGGSSNPFASLLTKPFNIFQTGFDASWELDLFGGNRRAEEAANSSLQASEASRDDVMISLRAEVARTYIALRAAQAQLAIVNGIIAANQKTLSLAQQRFAAGEAPRLDVTQATARLKQSQEQQPATRSRIAQAEYKMDVLLGAQPGTTRKLTARAAAIPASNKALVLTAPASVIDQRPDIRNAERRLASATAQQGVATAKFYPDISLTGFFGALNTSANKLLTSGSESWIAGGGILWPILSYGSLSANLDSANAGQQEALASYQKTVLSALSDVEQSLTAYNEQQKFLEAATEQTEHSRHARGIAEERHASGLTPLMDVLDADRTLYESELALTQARADAAQNLIALYKSLGGGWSRS